MLPARLKICFRRIPTHVRTSCILLFVYFVNVHTISALQLARRKQSAQDIALAELHQ